jgi:hypothetical protein
VILYLSVTVDVDNDGVATASERTRLSWDALEQVPALAQTFAALGLRTTWFVRADTQLEEIYGSTDHLLNEHERWWSAFRAAGDEIAWHPHVYRRDVDGSYVPETDEARFVAALERSWTDLEQRGYAFASARVGEGYCTNGVMACLQACRLRADSTAIPGRVRADDQRRFDWAPTPNRPYRPSAADYRVEGNGVANGLIEVPMTTATFEAAYDPRPLLRYMNPAYHHDVFRAGFDRYIAELGRDGAPSALTLIVHPEETVAAREPHGLYAFSASTVQQNLEYALAAATAAGWSVRPATTNEIAAAWAQPR